MPDVLQKSQCVYLGVWYEPSEGIWRVLRRALNNSGIGVWRHANPSTESLPFFYPPISHDLQYPPLIVIRPYKHHSLPLPHHHPADPFVPLGPYHLWASAICCPRRVRRRLQTHSWLGSSRPEPRPLHPRPTRPATSTRLPAWPLGDTRRPTKLS